MKEVWGRFEKRTGTYTAILHRMPFCGVGPDSKIKPTPKYVDTYTKIAGYLPQSTGRPTTKYAGNYTNVLGD